MAIAVGAEIEAVALLQKLLWEQLLQHVCRKSIGICCSRWACDWTTSYFG
ncbi:hypothetical protein GO684_03655 [Wolbachia endosymbiont of Litomosoides brasiliensis]|nr:hypothetical protein [Wolbachia endosymbiont of Litomosoides brasiliensis]NUY39742.1 hypothetical protein [Wolbachia endosymbiont of Litomosoides brasiliensis]